MQDKLETRSFLLMLLAVSIAFALILKPFWASIFWACAVAVIFYPLQIRLKRMLGRRSNRAALLTLLIATVIVVIPVLLVAYSFIQEGVQLYQKLSSGDVSIAQIVDKIEKGLPFLPDLLARLGIDIESLPRAHIAMGNECESAFCARSASGRSEYIWLCDELGVDALFDLLFIA